MKRRPADPLYVALSREVAAAGYFKPARAEYAMRTALLVVLFLAAYVTLLTVDSLLVVLPTLVVLAQVTAQLGYIAHDAGHRAITRNPRAIQRLGHFGMTFVTGFSFSWWMHSHDNHHSKLNERDNDLAMKYSLVLAVHADSIRGRGGWSRRLLRWQGYYVWLLMPFYHFAMMVDGFLWIARNRRETRADQIVLVAYLVLWFVVPVPFIGIWATLWHWLVASMVASIYLVLTFIPHHVGKKVLLPEDEPEMTLLRQQLETTRTIKTWRIWDWYYSGLNYHIEHHLFPWVPHWRYRSMRLLVQDFCRRHDIAYREQGFWSAVGEVFRHLDRLGRLPTAPRPDRVSATSRSTG